MTNGIKVSNYARPGSAAVNAPSTPGGTGGGLGSVTDGTTTVSPATELDFTSGATVTDLGGGIAGVVVTGGISGIEVKETDGSPDVTGVTVVQVPPGGLTNNGGGDVTLDLVPARNGGIEDLVTDGAVGATKTLDWSAANEFDLTLTTGCTISFSNVPSVAGKGAAISVVLRGSFAVTWPGSCTVTGTDPGTGTRVAAVWTTDGGTTFGVFYPGTGTVTSVALTVPAEFSVTGSPVTTLGTLAIAKANESANTVWAGPTSGAAAAPTFRALVAADIPTGTVGSDHEHVMDVLFSGDGSTVAFTLPAAPFDAYSVAAYVAGTLTEVTLSGALLDTATFGSAPGAATDNVRFDIVAAVV